MPPELNWEDWLTAKKDQLELNVSAEIENRDNPKLVYRFFTINCNGILINEDQLIHFLITQVTHFVFSKKDIAEFEEDEMDPLEEALKKFGDVDPIRDGKYGELLLYILTECYLGAPMVAQKLSYTYPNVQAKGSDGVFMGNYNGEPALFIGEAKMRETYSVCLSDAVSSIERFHNDDDFLKNDLWIAKKQLREDMSGDDLDYIYQSLKPNTETFSENSMVHPVLLMYKEKKISKLISESTSQSELEQKLKDLITKNEAKRVKSITDLCSELTSLEKVYMDYFLIPVESVSEFREKCYAAFHGNKRYVREES